MSKRTYKFSLFTIHGHLADSTPDYREIARRIVELKGRVRKDGNRLIVIGSAMMLSGASSSERVSFVTYSGDADRNVLFYDLNRLSEFSSQMESGRFVARKTHVLFDPSRRTLVIEAGRGHPPAEELAKMIEEELRKEAGFETLELSFTPVAAPTFISKIDQLQRIQAVSVSISRPNVDWSERYHQFTKLAEDSGAKAIDATVRARRNEGISKQHGIIPDLKHWLSDAMSSVSGARIKGALPGQSGLIELKLSDHIDTFNVTVDVSSEAGQPTDTSIQEKLNGYLDERGQQV
jgi:hypothetical protein